MMSYSYTGISTGYTGKSSLLWLRILPMYKPVTISYLIVIIDRNF